MPDALTMVVPGSIEQRTGGYVYDSRLLDELRALDRHVELIELDGDWPSLDADALSAAADRFAAVPDGSLLLIDALAGSAMPDVLATLAPRLIPLSLLHHPLALETGIDPAAAERLARDERDALRHAQAVIVTSDSTARALSDYGVPDERITVAEPGVDPAPVAPAHSGGPFHWLCVATVTPRKAHDTLISALARVHRQAPELAWSLTLVGSTTRAPDTVRAVRQRIAEAGLDERIELTGETDEATLAEHYRSAHGFTLASRHEGYGMVLSEALARALPIVATDGGAMADTVPDGAGHLVPVDDVAALADALQGVMSDADRYRELRAGALDARDRLPRWRDTAKRVARAIDAAMSGAPAPDVERGRAPVNARGQAPVKARGQAPDRARGQAPDTARGQA